MKVRLAGTVALGEREVGWDVSFGLKGTLDNGLWVKAEAWFVRHIFVVHRFRLLVNYEAFSDTLQLPVALGC